MTFAEYIADMDRRVALAHAVKASPDYLWQIATKRRKASHTLAKAIEDATNQQVTRHHLRPDIFGLPPQRAAA